MQSYISYSANCRAPQSLIDDIINSINTLIYKAVNAVELGLIQTPPSALGFSKAAAASNTIPDTDDKGNPIFPEAKAEIENGVHELETLLEATVDKDFDKFEIYCLRNVLSVPEDVASRIRLAHYEVSAPAERARRTRTWATRLNSVLLGPYHC